MLSDIMLSVIMLSISMLIVTMLNVVTFKYHHAVAKCRYAECYYVK
jgi:hypothetical protein